MSPVPAPLLWVTDGRGDREWLCARLAQAWDGGLRALQLREPELSDAVLRSLCVDLRAAHGTELQILLNDRPELVCDPGVPASGLHLPSRRLEEASRWRARLPAGRLLGCAVHDEAQIRKVAGAEPDFLVLAPVFPTASKPGHLGVGAVRAAELTALAPCPVYWLGGIDPQRCARWSGPRPRHLAVLGALAGSGEPAETVRQLRQFLQDSD